MKISINSTFSYVKFNLNYGSALQCYALQKYLFKRGHQPEHLRDYRANPKYILLRLKNIRYGKLFFSKIKAMAKMQKFFHDNLNFSKRGYLSDRSLKKHCPEVDCHIVGSDQIWHNTNKFRYLTYVPDDKLKLSYAASFGRANISKEMLSTINPYLKRFDGISVREKSAVGILKSINLDSKWLLDPTLLLDWTEYPYSLNNKTNYCYCYFLNLIDRDGIPWNTIKQTVSSMGKELLLTAPLNYYLFTDEKQTFPSVENWLGLYKNADYIFTNTYHGLLFCIIFKKQFIFFIQKGGNYVENERFFSLLQLLHLEDRIYEESSDINMKELMEKTINYDYVYQIINEKRAETDAFFKKFGI